MDCLNSFPKFEKFIQQGSRQVVSDVSNPATSYNCISNQSILASAVAEKERVQL
jgi:hypothetical protein